MRIKTKKELNRLSELLAMGYKNSDIANTLNQEFNENMTSGQVKRIIQKQAVLKRQLIKTDAEFKELHREMILNFISKINSNIDILEKFRKVLAKRFNELKKDIPESKLMTFTREASGIARAINDTARTMNELLKRTETETSELKVSAIESVQNTVSMLKELQDQGYIEILPEFSKSELYKETKKKT